MHPQISKSRICCHNSFEDNLQKCYILKNGQQYIVYLPVLNSKNQWHLLLQKLTMYFSIHFFNVRFTLLIFIKRSHSSPILINFVLHLLCLDTLTSVFTVSILSWMIEWIYVYSGIWLWKYQIWYWIQCCNEKHTYLFIWK